MISRRRFLQAGAAAGAMLALPRRAFPFSQSVAGIPKFTVSLPGLTTAGANELDNFIPVLSPDPSITTFDFYRITATQAARRFHSAIPNNTEFWAYGNSPTGGPFRYLGGVIIAHKGRPVRLQVTNSLPRQHILPTDRTLIDPVVGSQLQGRTDLITVHLHGGLVFWDDDGGPFSWFSSAAPANGGFIFGPSFENPGPAAGQARYNYSNDQSARTIWYHDHMYSLTRTNVYAGLASAYLITDTDELGTPTSLIDSGVLPGLVPTPLEIVGPKGTMQYPLGVPLILQDKTFWDGPRGHDPGYASVPNMRPPVPGSLWYPHVYEGGADPTGLPSMTHTDLPAVPPNHARWGANPVGAAPAVSTVPEFFSDTTLVNGAPYPKVKVSPRRYRFRIVNAAQARFYNLQLYKADFTASDDGITLAPFNAETDPNDNPVLKPEQAAGPAFIQIANEAGFLPHPVVFGVPNGTSFLNENSNRVMGYNRAPVRGRLHRRADQGITREVAGDRIRLAPLPGDPTTDGAIRFNLLLSPAERADVIIDFADFAGDKLILYNDAPGPFPGGDIRNDYYGKNPDLTSVGGAPSTIPGFGPDTRVLMLFEVDTTGQEPGELTFTETIAALEKDLPLVFKGGGGFQGRGDPPLPLVPNTTHGKSLLEDNDEFGRLRQLLGDGSGNSSTYLDLPIDIATEGEVQEWRIFNLTADTHPMHFHLVNVEVVNRATWKFNSDGTPDLSTGKLEIDTTTVHDPDPNEKGAWKETVRMNPGEVTTVRMKFDLPKPFATDTVPGNSKRLLASYGISGAEYVWHCHILEHEEHDMMHALVVLPKP